MQIVKALVDRGLTIEQVFRALEQSDDRKRVCNEWLRQGDAFFAPLGSAVHTP
jgi:hypothetical protein